MWRGWNEIAFLAGYFELASALLTIFVFDWPSVSEKIFEYMYYGHIHVYSPGAGADNLLRTFFHKHKSSVHLHTPSKFPPI